MTGIFRKMFKYTFSLVYVLSMLIVSGGIPAFAATQSTSSLTTDEIPYESYTYWEDYGEASKTPVYCKPMYKVKTVIGPQALGTDEARSITDICAGENSRIYILDGGASKVYIIDNDYALIDKIGMIVWRGEALSIEGASGIFVKDEKIYIADTKSARVLVIDKSGAVTDILTVPDSKLIPDDFTYRPVRVTVDSKGYTYIVSDGSYYGALVYSPEMEFLGFYGANTVKAGVIDALGTLFGRLFSNDAKKGASVLALPYQFNDLVCGPNDFIYTATGKSTDWRIQTGQICMMNPGGRNVLG